MSSNPRITTLNTKFTSSNLQVMSSNPGDTTLNQRVRWVKVRVAKLDARVGRSKAQVRRLSG